jgi:hypothetical protein
MRNARCEALSVLAIGVLASTTGVACAQIQPELSKFAPLDQQDLVDHFTGDFHYNLPLMEVPGPNGGYPIVMSYASGITPDQDASWVGLGWTLSPGAIARQMRGVPDDFDADQGDRITTILDIDPQRTYGLGIGGDYEFFGVDPSVGIGVSFGLTGYFDNYRGFGINNTVGLSAQAKSEGTSASVGLNIGEDTLEGAHIGATASLSLGDTMRFGSDLSYDAGRGLPSLSFSAQANYQNSQLLVATTGNVFDYLGYAKPAALPGTGRETQGSNIKVTFKAGGAVYGNFINGTMNGFYSLETLKAHVKTTPAVGYLHLDEAIRSADLTDPMRSAQDDDFTKTFALDFNREKDGPIYDQSPNLAMPILTNDFFIVSGRDITGTFRAYRNDTPTVFDPQQESDVTGGAIGVDVGFGDLVKVGVSGALNHSSTVIGRWNGGLLHPEQPNNTNTLLGTLEKSFTNDPTRYLERTYFKFIGEPTFVPPPGSANGPPVAPTLTGKTISDGNITAAVMADDLIPPFFYAAGTVDAQNNPIAMTPPTERVPRGTLIQAFTNDELRTMANALPDFAGRLTVLNSNPDAKAIRESHRNHLGGFRITAENGTRYIYGIAVYNTDYEEHKFSVDRKKLCPASGYCTIVSPPGPTAEETALGAAYDYKVAGSEQLLEIKKLSPYPTSFLLTAIVGPDYVDTDGIPGPSDGDVGYWVKFNYSLASTDFNWRTPYVGASFVRGPDNGRYIVGAERLSDKGYFSYGTRESWYLASVETATHKAFMCTDRIGRRDAVSAVDPGQIQAPLNGPERPWKLTSVRLYSKAELAGLTADQSTGCPNGTPLVEAHLDYENYDTSAQRSNNLSLANLTPNAPVGKLTLKQVYFTHLDSARGKLSPYIFDYGAGDATKNPDYHDGERDRWNTYQVPPPPPGTQANGAPVASPPLEDRMGWTDQTSQGHTDGNSSNPLDQWAGTWSLRKVTEPSGRAIAVQYEADDYGYVQDRPAMRFFPLSSVHSGTPSAASRLDTICPAVVGTAQASSIGATVDCATAGNPTTPARIYFHLECDDQGANCDTQIDHYVDLGDDSQIFFKIRVALKSDGQVPAKWQTITGYANLRDAGIAGNGIGWIDLVPVHSNYPKQLDYHPLAHAAWQYLRLQQPELIQDGGINGDPSGDPLKEALNVMTLADALPQIIQSLNGLYPGWLVKGWGQSVDLDNSWVRLKDPNGIKKGGGARVHQITVSDNWSASTAGKADDLATGYVYTYRLEDGLRSSGVAAYEPMVASDENPLRQAKSFTDQVLLSSDYNLFAELPIGETHYPAPAVGYSRVVRHSLAAQNDIQNEATRPHPTSAGPTVFEFYTARDFPVQSQETLINKQRLPFPQLIDIPLLGTITISSLAASQGYLTTINDMHGKPKRVANYQYTDHFDTPSNDYVLREDPIKETIYHYSATGGVGDTPFKLDNSTFQTLSADPDPLAAPPVTAANAISQATLAQQADSVVDLRQNRTESFDGGVNINVDTFLIAYVPVPIPVPIPNFGYSLTETKTVVTSRVVHQAGILDSVSVRQGAAQITTRNDLYDPLTGGALLSQADNLFGNPIFSYDMPTRWSYPRMGPAYTDVGRSIDLTSGTLDSQATRLAVPAASIGSCPDSQQQSAQAAPAATQHCLPLGTELAVPTADGGIHLTLLKNDDATHTTVFGIDGDKTGNASSNAVVVRSGNRNLLAAMTDNIRALSDPTIVRVPMACGVTGIGLAIGPGFGKNQELIHDVLDAHHTSFEDYWPAGANSTAATDILNSDYATGVRGIFRPASSYVYRADRSQSQPVDVSKDGTFDAALFGPGQTPRTCALVWLPTLTHTRYSPAGYDIENFNALNIYSASQYGAGGTLPFAVASNATYDEIGFEGFETNIVKKVGSDTVRASEGSVEFAETSRCILFAHEGPCENRQSVVSIANDHAHTGKRSLRVNDDQSFDQPRLSLRPDTSYLVSGWVSLGVAGSTAADVATYAPASGASGGTLGLQVSYKPPGGGAEQVLGTFKPDGPIIEGWQRIEGVFQAPSVASGEKVTGLVIGFLNSGPPPVRHILGIGNQPPAYFDDIRIQPEDASLVGFVYDLDTRRMTAQLDENNFATFYRYAPDGKVDLVRRETVRGVFSQKEGRFHTKEQP